MSSIPELPADAIPRAPPRPVGEEVIETREEAIAEVFEDFSREAITKCTPPVDRPLSERISFVLVGTNEALDQAPFFLSYSLSSSAHTTHAFALAVYMLREFSGAIDVDYGRVWAQCVLGGGNRANTYSAEPSEFNRSTQRFNAMLNYTMEMDIIMRKLKYEGSWMFAAEQVTQGRGVQRIVAGSGLSARFPAIALVRNVLESINADTGALNTGRVERNLARSNMGGGGPSRETEAFKELFIWEKEREQRESLEEGVAEAESMAARGL